MKWNTNSGKIDKQKLNDSTSLSNIVIDFLRS